MLEKVITSDSFFWGTTMAFIALWIGTGVAVALALFFDREQAPALLNKTAQINVAPSRSAPMAVAARIGVISDPRRKQISGRSGLMTVH